MAKKHLTHQSTPVVSPTSTSSPANPSEEVELRPVLLSPGWKFTSFLWATSMIFLGLYDFLSQILRILFRR